MRSMLRAALLAATAILPAAAGAQTATGGVPAQTSEPIPGEPGQADAPNGVGDIVVTARKQAERLQEVPIAITAFDAEEIQSARIQSLADVAKLTPGLNFTPLFGRQNQLPIIRGAAQTFGQLNVGVFLDGVYLAGKGGVDLEINDLERVEVIRGPQSALYGRNTFAGAINYVTRRPTQDLSGRALVEVGERGLRRGLASVSGPLSDTVRVRLGGFYREFDGFYRSGIDGGRVDFDEGYGAIGTVEWEPTDQLIVTLRGSYSDEDFGQPASSVIRNNAAPGVPAGAPATQRRNLLYIGQVPSIPRNGVLVNTADFPNLPGGSYGDREESIRGSATVEYDFGDVLFTSITAYAKRNAEFTFDGDNTICDTAIVTTPTRGCPNFGFAFVPAIPVGSSAFALSSTDGYLRDVSQELRFQSNGGERFDWLFGVFYYDNITYSEDRGLSPSTTSGATAFSSFNTNYSYPRTRLTTKSYAVFGSVTLHATDRFDVTGELRYEYEKQGFTQCPTFFSSAATAVPVACATRSPAAITPTTPFTGSVAVFDLRQDFRFITPRVIANYQATPDVLLYASYARGAKTGGFNTGLNIFNDQRTYEPEYSNNYEVGFKSDLFDRRLRFNLAAFYIDWNDQQAACQNPITAGGTSTQRTYTCNVAAATIKGVETDMVARVTDWFSVAANYAYTDARYDRFVDDSLAAVLVAAGRPPIDFDGNRLPYVPRHKFVVTPQLDFQLSDRASVEARADLQYQSRSYLRADNLQSFGERSVVDLRLTGRYDNFSLQLFANNVFDNKVPQAGVRFFDFTNFSVASPLVTGAPRRLIGASLGYSF